MLLVIDVGNSHTVLGLYDGPDLYDHWRLVSSNYRTADEWRIMLLSLLQQENISPDTIEGCCISSVVPPVNSPLKEACVRTFPCVPLFVGPGIRTGLIIQIENPKEVGADRIVNAVGALESYSPPLIIIDFGTATTFDVVTANAEYRGGVIFPGVHIAADALFRRCAKLPRVDVICPENPIGQNTVSSICSGLTYGYADLTDGLVRRISAEISGNPTVLATGGYASVIAAIAQTIDQVEPNLTLKGLYAIYQKNRKGE